jgi:hypothetical protein
MKIKAVNLSKYRISWTWIYITNGMGESKKEEREKGRW